MPQPKHLRAPAIAASTAVAAPSSFGVMLDNWTSLSPFAVPVLATSAMTRRPAPAHYGLLARLPWARRLGAA
ncbi:conserved hypothetical protein [Pseudomonas sp. 8Z]|uniref:hypothetical protein n=1 Tax=Pseudomonas sp. 8Z TaxID=2653166 RepID=UPI0012F2B1A9|nr:hypothetical protein [Pseudomonas sp. 8Z]VXC81950.1 conserved hypothetical protein [Pseudomonas sp. 8Z]